MNGIEIQDKDGIIKYYDLGKVTRIYYCKETFSINFTFDNGGESASWLVNEEHYNIVRYNIKGSLKNMVNRKNTALFIDDRSEK